MSGRGKGVRRRTRKAIAGRERTGERGMRAAVNLAPAVEPMARGRRRAAAETAPVRDQAPTPVPGPEPEAAPASAPPAKRLRADESAVNEISEMDGKLEMHGGLNESEVEKIASHLQDGRLVELSKSFLMRIKNCSDLTNKGGGFGKIYISRVPIPGFKHRLVLKAIGGDDENSKSQTQLFGSVKNEKLASRVRHFAIVPLLAYHDDLSIGVCYLISPYFENGDLFDALRSDNGDNVLLDWKTRLKVSYQIACGIDYMHTSNSFRGTILHLDIKSKNIVLDNKFNARLIDFGLSRESMTGSNITTAPLAGTELYRPPGVHKTSPLLDYYAFGVVIRELLTGLGPEGTCRSQTPLGRLDMVNFEDVIQRRIWTIDYVWKSVSSIASRCISSVDDDETSGQISSALIRTSLKSILIKESIQKWSVLDDNNCEICIVNGQLEKEDISFRRVSEINHSNCATKIKICCACMRNSYINPVKCQECDNEIKSIIGDGWGAILIAGFDEDNDSFRNDVMMFAQAISSKVLPSMCVSTVITIDSATQTTEPVSVRIDDAFNTVMRHNVHTLVFLYSGHHGNDGFKVGMNEYVSMQHINRKIQECTHVEKVIAFVDCCQPEIFRVKEERRLIQFNATASTDTAISLRNEGSPFTKLLVQAFTMKASGGKCALPHCECRIDGPFITIDSLSHYIEIHRQNGLLRGMEPDKSLMKINWQNECLAYNNSYKVAFRFDIVLPEPFTSKHTYEVLATTVNDYDALIQTILFPRFADLLGEQLNVHQKSMSHADKNADCLCIVYDTGPKWCEEVDNIEKLVLAWNSKRLLCCKLRFSLTGNCHKPSGFFLKNERI
ncbi:uncharacterized protein LOC127836681 [Dreissena polymorpha]|uniref:uncharacterized protein LOC127836681 n=1 Tax=Dreissena polymorpha TaxID=45954 RepID=UPI002264E697|nr:uncharacterized protein LOC127836681 [Dreissena polymorpha]